MLSVSKSVEFWSQVFGRLAWTGGVAIAVALLGLLALKIAYGQKRRSWPEAFTICVSISLIGALIGDLSGTSQESVAGQLVPAILTLIGAFGLYIFGIQEDHREIINISILIFVISIALCYADGVSTKRDYDDFLFCREKYADKDILANQMALQNFNSIFSEYCGDLIGRYTVSSPSK